MSRPPQTRDSECRARSARVPPPRVAASRCWTCARSCAREKVGRTRQPPVVEPAFQFPLVEEVGRWVPCPNKVHRPARGISAYETSKRTHAGASADQDHRCMAWCGTKGWVRPDESFDRIALAQPMQESSSTALPAEGARRFPSRHRGATRRANRSARCPHPAP